jgi:anti-sigma B factor antagonist
LSRDSLSIDVQAREDGIHIFHLRGDLDVATAPTLRGALIEASTAGKHELIVDLSDLGFLDSTGLGALIGAHRRAQENGGDVRLVARDGQILRLLRITGLLGVFRVYATIEAALADEARLVGL